MAYVKNNWVDREGTTRYFETVDDDGALIFTPDYTQVTEIGTPVNADNMNHIEEGIAAGSFTKYDPMTTYAKDDLVTAIVENELKVYKSLQDNNNGNVLIDSSYWEEVGFAGGGLEIGDIGIAPLGIDETKGKRRYLNGQIIIQDQYTVFTEKLKRAIELYPSLACTEDEWQATALLTVGGQVGKFVVDDEAGTIRLPKIIMPIQGLTDLSKLAEIVEAGLPNITGKTSGWYLKGDKTTITNTGAISTTKENITYAGTSSNTGQALNSISIDASNSSSVYGNSDTVQQEQIQYPYFIQVATGAETEDNITNTIELNNPFSLLDYKYSEYELNNLSWLRSNGQYNSKADYTAVYELLLKIYNGTETKAGVNVKLATETYTDYDFVLNTADETFRLPIKVKQTPMSGIAPIYGDGHYIAFAATSAPDVAISMGQYSTDGQYRLKLNNYNSEQSVALASKDAVFYNSDTTVLERGTGLYADLSEATNPNLYLYFYVGETIQNANLINAGRIEEKISSLVTVVETYQNGASGYRIWSNKYCEQWGKFDYGSLIDDNAGKQVVLIKPFLDSNYILTGNIIRDDRVAGANGLCSIPVGFFAQTDSSFYLRWYATASETARYAYWKACGYIA